MTEFRARIGRIRMKDGGAEVRLLRNNTKIDGGEDRRGSVLKHARMVADMDEPGSRLVSHITIGIFSDGRASIGFRYDKEECPVPISLFPAWIAEIVRRDVVTDSEARDIFHEMFEWKDG